MGCGGPRARGGRGRGLVHTGERIRARRNVIELNRNYPKPWSISVRRIVASGNEVAVAHPGGISHCLGFYELADGRIRRATEYWVDGGAEVPPAWRARWVEPV
ncbi:MAG TPA: hypothetical protein VJK66_02690 [Gaiellaceae bacterium]|nr:hypothetical protein [Gaiellaceae bacterium]